MRGIFPIRSFSLEKQAAEERPTDRFCFTHVALGMDFQDKHRVRQSSVWGGGGGEEGGGQKEKKPSLASVRSL